MKVNILASGSSGNCIALTIDDKTILIDAGIAKTKIEKALLDVGIKAIDVQAIFITHAHKDHTKGLPLANKYNIPVYAGEDEWKDIHGVDEELQLNLPDTGDDYNTGNILFDHEGFGDWFKVCPFNVHHDAYDPRGYTVISNDSKVSICLDTGYVDSTMIQAMKNSHLYIIEANHEPKMVERCERPPSVKARILSDNGHLSNQQVAEALSELLKGKGEQIYLVHLSNDNNFPGLAEMTVEKELLNRGLIKNKHYKLEVV